MIKKPTFPRRNSQVSLFIDVSNIYYSQQTLGWKIDYSKVLNYFKNHTKLVSAFFYSGVVSKDAKQQKFFSKMKQFGFVVKTKEVKWIRDKNSKTLKGKGNLDIELALDMSHTTKKYTVAVLFSGDSDFTPVVEFVQAKRKKVIVFSSRGHISRELARAADLYIPFESMREEFERKIS
ncbi:MAG: hypothetical protein A2782_02140 [Candidatus Blackburnbacteria bacterium RIFCSPHIGHO2_01_FULL_43_15b]|uniref:NYN domain-containing protein n=1 Tax=Candidatus Blackburnbacteria bacterium RIFCSPHIGHO2_01_FULL_43_15b TaxID=1797513 RepID=A0A1G1V0L6_9BACT|nr:MAG: hypothetical protein A2782_02140 [Candidatus Blackburnbacteria bacterium RIFCSPHIGHO2_01_FULL_43_15b]